MYCKLQCQFWCWHIIKHAVYNLHTWCRANPAIRHCSHLLLKMKSGYNNKSLAKSTLGGWKITYLWKSVFWSAFGFSNIAFIIPSHFKFIIVTYLTLWMLPSGCQTVLIQIRPDILPGLILVQTVYRCYQQTTKVAASGQRVRYKSTCWYCFLA